MDLYVQKQKYANWIKVNLFCLFLFFSLSGQANKMRSACEELYTKYLNEYKNKNYTQSLEYLNEVEEISITNQFYDLQAQVLNAKGLVYFHLLDYDKALDCYFQGYEIALKREVPSMEISILSNLAQLYYTNKEIEHAINNLNKAYLIAQSMNDTVRMARISINIAIIANETEKFEDATHYLNMAIDYLSKKPQYEQSVLKAKFEKVKNYYYREEFFSALQLISELMDDIEKIDIAVGKSSLYLWLSRIYYQLGNVEKAIDIAYQSLDNQYGLSAGIEIFEHLSLLYRREGSLALALQYQDSLLKLNDLLNQFNDQNRMENMQVRLKLIESEKELAENKIKIEKERLFFALLIVIAIFLIWILRLRLIRNRQHKILELEIEQKEKLMLQQKLKAQETSALLEKERLNGEINEKNRQLAAKVLLQSNKNELITEVIEKMLIISKQINNQDFDSLIQQLRRQSKETTEWDGFLTYFEQINPSFLSLLKEKHPDLSSGEIRLLSYIYINLDTKEIAKLLNVTPEHCRKKKQRLAKKMGIITSDIHTYLANLT